MRWSPMSRVLLCAAALLVPSGAAPVGAQTPAEASGTPPSASADPSRPGFWPESLLFGVSVGRSRPVDRDTTTGAEFSFVGGPVRRSGFSPALSLGWFSTDVVAAPRSASPVAEARVRPVMAGLAWGQRRGAWLIQYSGVVGYAFNSLDRPPERATARRSRLVAEGLNDVRDSVAWELGVEAWRPIGPRLHGVVAARYLWTRPAFVLADGRREAWTADRVVVEAGAAWELRLPRRRPATP